jgi:hypothetical protein
MLQGLTRAELRTIVDGCEEVFQDQRLEAQYSQPGYEVFWNTYLIYKQVRKQLIAERVLAA